MTQEEEQGSDRREASGLGVSALDLAEIETFCKMSVQCREAAKAALQAAGVETVNQLDRLALQNLRLHLRTIWASTQVDASGQDLDASQDREKEEKPQLR